MYKRLLRSALAVAFSAVVAFGTLSGVGLIASDAVTPLDSGWGGVQAAGPADSGWGSTPLTSTSDSGWG
jgi:hypothetical protein